MSIECLKFIDKNFLGILKYHLTKFYVCINIILNGRKKFYVLVLVAIAL